MSSTKPDTAILTLDLGTAATYDQRIFPLAYYECSDDLSKGGILINTTLEEMERIRDLGIDLNNDVDFIFNTRLKLEALNAKKAKLQNNRKTLNPFKAFINYRAARLFHAASKTLCIRTKVVYLVRTSERIHRDSERMRVVVPSTQLRVVNDPLPPDTKITGLAVALPDGWSTDAERTINDATETIATTTNPFQDDFLTSQLRDDEQIVTLDDTASLLTQDAGDSSVCEDDRPSVVTSQQSYPTSPQTINHIHIYQDSIVTTSSNVTGLTVNRDTQNSSGASVTQEFVP